MNNVHEALDSPANGIWIGPPAHLLAFAQGVRRTAPVVLAWSIEQRPAVAEPVEYVEFEGFGFEATDLRPQKCDGMDDDGRVATRSKPLPSSRTTGSPTWAARAW